MKIRHYENNDYLRFKPKDMHLREMPEAYEEALADSVSNSFEVYSLTTDKDEVVGVGGIVTNTETPLVWLICSEVATDDLRGFLRLTSKYLDHWLRCYGTNRCWLLQDNLESIRWLKFNGYTEVDTINNGKQWVCYERS